MRIIVPALFLLMVFPIDSPAQNKMLTGIVINSENGETLPSASIVIEGTNISTTTNVDGYFTLFKIPDKTFTLQVFYLGCHPYVKEISPDETNDRITIKMISSSIEIEEVFVTSRSYKMMKIAEGVSDIRVVPNDLKSLPSFGEVDIFRSLQLLPGISGTNESSSGLYVRGGTPDQNLVLLDGMTVYNVDHFFGFFSAFNADAIKDIQMYKGGYPAKYGGRISSVVDLTGKSGDPNNFHMSTGVNLLSANACIEVPLGGKGSVLLSGRRSYTDFIESSLYNKIYDMLSQENSSSQTNSDSQTGSMPGGMGGGSGGGFGSFEQPEVTTTRPSFYFYDLNGKISYRPTQKDNISVSLYSGNDNLFKNNESDRELTSDREDFVNREVTTSNNEDTKWGNKGASFKWSRQWGPRFYSNLLGAYSHYFSKYNQSDSNITYDSNADTLMNSITTGSFENNFVNEFSARLDNEWQISNTNQLDFGLTMSQTAIEYKYIRDDTMTILNRDEAALLLSGYLGDSWKPTKTLEVGAGIRTDWFQVTSKVYVEPRLSVLYKPTTYLTFKGATGKYHQFVNRVINENVTEGSRDFWLLSDDEMVEVQSSWHYIVGTSLENKDLLFDVEAYYKTMQGLSEFSLRYRRNNIELDQLFFQGEGVAKGIEFLLQKKQGEFTGWITYTLSKVTHQFDGMNNNNPFPALHDQTHEIKVISNYEPSKHWKFSATWVYGSGKPYTAPESQYQIDLLDGSQFSYISVGAKNAERLPAYHRMDIAAHYLFNLKKFKMDTGFSVFNLYNHTNVWYRQFDLQELPMVVNEITYLGITPNVSINISF